MIICRNVVDEPATPIKVLFILKKKNVEAFQMFLLLCVYYWPYTSAGAKRSFFKLKLIKIFLRHSMFQQTLTGLATLAIEEDVSEKNKNKLWNPNSKLCSTEK